jgi:prephenate dehydratase
MKPTKTARRKTAARPSSTVGKRLKIGYEGVPGAYSEMAIRQLYGRKVEAVGFPDFPSVHDALRKGIVDRAALPVENTIAGTASLKDNWEILAQEGFHAIAETVVHVHHCLLALPGTRIEDIREIRIHPQPVIQCKKHLAKLLPKAKKVPGDTAGSARQLSITREPGVAVIASRLAAETYGLEILHEGMEDDPSNFTRFLIAAREASPPPRGKPLKTSIAFTLDNAGPGSLFRALGAFALRDIDLARIESHPIPGAPWRYRFFLDLRSGASEPRCARAIEHLGEMVTELSILGTYAAWSTDA